MRLAFKKLGSGSPIIILHGLYGSSDNWFNIGKILSQKHEVYLIDQRNHGRSPHSNDHTYQGMVGDLLEFHEKHKLNKTILIGHSMGGKTAMLFALYYPQKIKSLIIVDISPKSYTGLTEYQSHSIEHLNIMKGFISVDLSQMKDRNEIDMAFSKFVPDNKTRYFLLKNIRRNADGNFSWIINIEALKKSLPLILNGIDFKKLNIDKELISYPVLFVRGEKSNYILDEDISLIHQIFPKAELVTIFNAGHWLHAEQPELFLNSIRYFLEQ